MAAGSRDRANWRPAGCRSRCWGLSAGPPTLWWGLEQGGGRRVGGRRLTSANYPVLDRAGNIWCANSTHAETWPQALDGRADGFIFVLRPDGSSDIVAEGLKFPNGMALSADDRWLYAGCDDGNVYDLTGKVPRLAYSIAEDVDIMWLDISGVGRRRAPACRGRGGSPGLFQRL